MPLFEELKRRNVFRVGAAYLISAWLVLQISDVVLNNIEAPSWIFQTIMLLLGIGLPICLIFAWAFELTPEGIKREREIDRSKTISIMNQTGRRLNVIIVIGLAFAAGYFF